MKNNRGNFPRGRVGWPARTEGNPLPSASRTVSRAGADASDSLVKEIQSLEMHLKLLKRRLLKIEGGRPGIELVAAIIIGLCVACGLCREVCPAGAVSLGQTAWIDKAACTGCGLCVESCPRNAIYLMPPDGSLLKAHKTGVGGNRF